MESDERTQGDLRPWKSRCGQVLADGAERGSCATQGRERGVSDEGTTPLSVFESLAMRSLRHRLREGERFSLAEQMADQQSTSLLCRMDGPAVSALGASLAARGLLRDEGGGEYSLTERGKRGQGKPQAGSRA